jgi:hypothetical protein
MLVPAMSRATTVRRSPRSSDARGEMISGSGAPLGTLLIA